MENIDIYISLTYSITMNNFNDELENEIKKTEKLLAILEEKLQVYTPGFLICRKSLSSVTFYECDSKGNKIGGSGQASFDRVKEITLEVYIREELKRLKNNLTILLRFRRKYQSFDSESILEALPAVYRHSYLYLTKTEGEEHQNSIDVGAPTSRTSFGNLMSNPMDSENTIDISGAHITLDGTMVRSLAEMVIYNTLKQYGVPFAYEKKLLLKTVDGYKEEKYPDFTIFVPKKTMYWEHAGMYGDPGYRISFEKKLKLYYDNDIVLGSNLIVTVSKSDRYIDSGEIDKIVRALAQELT